MSKYVCNVCGWEYHPEEGYLEQDIEPDTPFEQLPDDFVCPVCGVEKEEFTEQ